MAVGLALAATQATTRKPADARVRSVTATSTQASAATTATTATTATSTSATAHGLVCLIPAAARRLTPTPPSMVRSPSRPGVEVVLPGGADFAKYISRLQESGAFPAQLGLNDAQLASLTAPSPTASAPAAKPANAPPARDERPVVGIILSEPKMLVAGAHANTDNIIALVEAMGCRPVLLPPCADVVVDGGYEARAAAMRGMVAGLDGLVGPGGADVDPAMYGEHNTAAVGTNLARDVFEFDLVRLALDEELFGFGICRSHQLWNAAGGGSLVQDVLKEGLASTSQRQSDFGIPYDQPLVVDGFEDRVDIVKGSDIAALVKKPSMLVNSLHHQAVDEAGLDFRVTGTVLHPTGRRAIESTERHNAITVQFHPELMQQEPEQQTLFSTVGRRAHAYALWKRLGREGKQTLPALLQEMRNDARYLRADIEWAQRTMARR